MLMFETLFILFLLYIGWRVFQVILALLIQIFLFFVKLVCLSLVILVIYFFVKDIKIDNKFNQPSYAIPIPGKQGFVVSPYSNQGIIDIKGVSSGTIIKDPYSTNNLLVP